MKNPDWEAELTSFLTRGDAPGFALVYLDGKEVTVVSNYATDDEDQEVREMNNAMIIYLFTSGIKMIYERETEWEIKYKN